MLQEIEDFKLPFCDRLSEKKEEEKERRRGGRKKKERLHL